MPTINDIRLDRNTTRPYDGHRGHASPNPSRQSSDQLWPGGVPRVQEPPTLPAPDHMINHRCRNSPAQAQVVRPLTGAFAVNTGAKDHPKPDRFVLFLAALAGSVIAASWWLLLRSYRDLNKAKFAVILRIERDYLDLQLFDEEWKELKKDPIKKWRPRYAEQGAAERIVPIVFLLLYLVLAVYVLVG